MYMLLYVSYIIIHPVTLSPVSRLFCKPTVTRFIPGNNPKSIRFLDQKLSKRNKTKIKSPLTPEWNYSGREHTRSFLNTKPPAK
ncbi:hypothetical protein BDV38DRAFT_113804 [Aspergillus pseudotamarii]|uniref:Uncharacterized protein n=1 Tax=Aspergillus pseudotamarii TaxID=132259 RepID=A0A5N6SNN7_ASPPS|nr:uncharacterized protein BDV38DRAFT_113804 [Aspergillus pseudotamarii]KAE8136298.1 hypothetical protein BDV38DRAFT_113804 [Aspergillus pseudotamarii]